MAVGKKLQSQRRASNIKKKYSEQRRKPLDARLKLRKNSILKSGTRNQISLYSSHFDARNKISNRDTPAVRSLKTAKRKRIDGGESFNRHGMNNNMGNSRIPTAKVRPGGNIAQVSNSSWQVKPNQGKQLFDNEGSNVKAQMGNENRKGNLAQTSSTSRAGNTLKGSFNAQTAFSVSKGLSVENTVSNSSKNKRKHKTPSKTGCRETTYTGKSIQISTKNELASCERRTMVKGKSLSVTTKNRTNSRGSQKHLQKTIRNSDLSYESQHQPSPKLLPSSSKKLSLPAKLVISNLHPNVTQEDILELFGAIGPLREGRIQSVGTAEVIFKVAEDAFAAYSKYHGRNLDGQPMILNIATAEEDGYSGMLPISNRTTSSKSTTATNTSSYYPTQSNSAGKNQPVIFTVKL